MPLLFVNAVIVGVGLGFVLFYGLFPGLFWLECITAAFVAYAAARVRELYLTGRAARRAASRKCVTCGYDLRVNTGRCPECGTSIYISEAYTTRPWWLRQRPDRRYGHK